MSRIYSSVAQLCYLNSRQVMEIEFKQHSNHLLFLISASRFKISA